MKRNDEDEVYVLLAPCGEEIEVQEPMAKLFSWCDVCHDYQWYLAE